MGGFRFVMAFILAGACVGSAWARSPNMSRLTADVALGARWIELETEAGILVAQETEVTRAQWVAVMGEGVAADPNCASEDCPATDITPLSMMVFANRLSDLEGFDRCYDIVGGEGEARLGRVMRPSSVVIIPHCAGYRLPTHDEWAVLIRTEPYARPGTPESWLQRVGWVADESKDTNAMPVAQKWPSNAGLYDLIGNVVEVALLPEPRPDVAILDRTLLPASLVMLGCASAGRRDNCFWPHSPTPSFVQWYGPYFGFRLVRSY